LTPLQAKIYLVSIQGGKEKIKTIARIANIDRSSTYQAVIQLQEIGLIEKILGTPNLYQAAPIEEGVSTLLKHKEDQSSEIQKEAGK
jgi:sugar-specific transcriptional regulator TrmB